jgi:M6 family metalloprotease-like protein
VTSFARFFVAIPCCFGAALNVAGSASAADALPSLAEFRTVETCQKTEEKTNPAASAPITPGRTGYLGIAAKKNDHGGLLVTEVATDSPADKAGLIPGDEILAIAGTPVDSPSSLRDALQSQRPGSSVSITVRCGDKERKLSAQLDATSKPLALNTQRVVMGIRLSDAQDTVGALIQQITEGGPAAKAGLKSGDIIAKVDGLFMTDSASLRDALAGKSPGDKVKVQYRRADDEKEIEVELTADTSSQNSANTRSTSVWRRDVYRLAVILIEYPDTKHNDKVQAADWDRALFSEARYIDKSPTGQTVYGSVNDYYRELSCGKFRLEGKVFDWVEAKKNRLDYAATNTSPSEKTALLAEVLDKLREREGKNFLGDFDGLCFIYAGNRVRTVNRGSLYWPHRSSITYNNTRLSYFIVAEGGEQMGNISVIAHEFGHMLGLPDLYARPENPGSEGLSIWCAMSNQAPNGRPQHMSAWCKERLGWLKPAVIDPTVPQKLILGHVEGSDRECYKVLVRADGSEYLLLENRRKQGFDASLPAEGLLIWRVVGGRPMLEEAHGIEGPTGPTSNRDLVPYPSRTNNAFTPYTIPSSRSQLGGGLPIHITNIRELPDGRITFYIGYEFQ